MAIALTIVVMIITIEIFVGSFLPSMTDDCGWEMKAWAFAIKLAIFSITCVVVFL